MARRPPPRFPLALIAALLGALVAAGPAAAETVTIARAGGAETYALSLLNCTRTGGFVNAAGECRARGSGTYSAKRKPLRLHKGISAKVAWPWARALLANDVCDHVIAGKPTLAQRLRRKGYRYPVYGENLGCASGYDSPRDVVLAVHRLMQAEKKWQGKHWRNIKDRRFRSVGIGVATRDGKTTVVWDFYGKRY